MADLTSATSRARAVTARTLRFEFDGGPTAEASLHEELAPATVELLWSALTEPVSIPAIHAMYAGPEIMMDLPQAARTFDPADVPAENQQVVPAPGDVIWYHQAPGSMAGTAGEIWEVGVFYGRGGRIFGPLGWTPCNVFASITSGLPAFAQACADIRLTGARKITISRVG
jgi:hypothetical protein